MAHLDASLYDQPGLRGERRRQVARILEAALAAVDPAQAVRRALTREGSILTLAGQQYNLDEFEHIYVVGAGKAGAPMAMALEELLGERITAGSVTVKYGHTAPTRRIKLMEAGHPMPDAAGVRGAAAIEELLSRATARDLVLVLISGGGSALLPAPLPGITLADLQALTSQLLSVGATITEVNSIRKHLDTLKGGRLAARANGARVAALILSDIVGNPLEMIASGPTAADATTYADALTLLERYQLRHLAPHAIRGALERGARGELAETLKPGAHELARVQNVIIASNAIAASAAEDAARLMGFNTLLLTTYLEGEAREAARVLVGLAKEVLASGRPVARPACILCGGETTVTLRGNGRGGRNQELALAAAIALRGIDNVMLAALATDGSDGPTDAAGALAEGDTLERAQALGQDAHASLLHNDSYTFFSALGDLLLTGPTNTNVNDLIGIWIW
ncbi:MAG: glycerate kinase [Chloroflexi bacterium]|nr:glycerate kinase [Chloroflexota bacterium]